MKQNISGPAGIAVVVIVAIVICVFFYFRYFHKPSMSTEEAYSRAGSGLKAMQEEYLKKHGTPLPMPPGPSSMGTSAATK